MKKYKYLKYIYLSLALILSTIITLIISITVTLLQLIKINQNDIQLLARFWAKILLKIFNCRIIIKGLTNLKSIKTYIFISNHSSLLDILILLAILPHNFRWIAKKELFNIPIFGLALKSAGYIPIDRLNQKAAIHSILEATNLIQQKKVSVIIFPEGTRSQDGLLLPFKSGGFIIALRSKKPIVPIAIIGTHKILPSKSLLLKSGSVLINIGKPIIIKGTKNIKKRYYLSELTRQKILTLLNISQN